MSNTSASSQGMHLMAKPIGPLCNLDCSYCFYLEKEAFYPDRHRFRMSDEVLRAYVERYIAAQATPEVEFTWQGGEPLLMGLEFFERAVTLQREYAGDKVIRNTLQTNGTLLDETWCEFLRRERFAVGLSLDGPREVHDLYRPDKQGRSSFDDVMRGLHLLQRYDIPVNTLVTVARDTAKHPLEIYRFLVSEGVRYIQFNPVVERATQQGESRIGLHFARPPKLSPGARKADDVSAVTPHSVEPGAYGDFLNAIFDQWVRNDVGRVHVMNFEWALAAWCQMPATVCLFSARCGKAAIVEHDGNVYSCDHFMYPEYRLGNIREDDPSLLIASDAQIAFGAAKETSLPDYCVRCPYRFACHGECPKNRFVTSPDGEAGLNYLCPGYKRYFSHITPAMNAMAQLLSQGLPAETIMQAYKRPLMIKLPAKQVSPHGGE
ncbi:anaerobic sulfatase maturase [Paraburkholderia fungorum]|uniref:anaerobic sulfatase maturase n=1 Tax=Paraburkholderia fungorum TaxID=134537 RepID=UPI0038BCD640